MKPNPGNYGYSNVAYAMLYWLFEKVGGLESYATQKLFKPYNLNKTGWNFPDEKIAQGHNIGGLPVSPWHASAMATSLGLKSSMDEMMIILEVISRKLIQATPPLTKSLKKELKALYKADEYKVIDGWFLIKSGKDLLYYKTGRTGGHQVTVAFMPQKRKGVIVFSNGTLGSNNLSLLVLDMINRAK